MPHLIAAMPETCHSHRITFPPENQVNLVQPPLSSIKINLYGFLRSERSNPCINTLSNIVIFDSDIWKDFLHQHEDGEVWERWQWPCQWHGIPELISSTFDIQKSLIIMAETWTTAASRDHNQFLIRNRNESTWLRDIGIYVYMYMEAITAPKWAGSSVRKLNFDFAPMLRYGVLGPKVIRWVKCCVGGGFEVPGKPRLAGI